MDLIHISAGQTVGPEQSWNHIFIKCPLHHIILHSIHHMTSYRIKHNIASHHHFSDHITSNNITSSLSHFRMTLTFTFKTG